MLAAARARLTLRTRTNAIASTCISLPSSRSSRCRDEREANSLPFDHLAIDTKVSAPTGGHEGAQTIEPSKLTIPLKIASGPGRFNCPRRAAGTLRGIEKQIAGP